MKVVYKDQIFPIWVESQVYVFVRVVDFEPSIKEYTCINGMTRLIIEPFRSKSSADLISNSITEFSFSTSNIKFIETKNSSDFSGNCSSSASTVKVARSFLKRKIPDLKLNGDERFLVKIERVKSPIQAFKVPSSSASLMRKFLQSIDTSFPSDYLLNQDRFSKGSLFAVMVLDDSEPVEALQVPRFLRQQLSLFENAGSVLINAEAYSKHESKFSSISKIKVLLKTDFNTEAIFLYQKIFF